MDSENIVMKGENAGIQHFLLFSHSFLLVRRKIRLFEQYLIPDLLVL